MQCYSCSRTKWQWDCLERRCRHRKIWPGFLFYKVAQAAHHHALVLKRLLTACHSLGNYN